MKQETLVVMLEARHFSDGRFTKDSITSWKRHISQKIKGIKYSYRDFGTLMKKEMKKNKHTSKDICEKYGIDEDEFKALVSGLYSFNFSWYEIVSDYTGIPIKELTDFKPTLYSKLRRKISQCKYNIH